jgi:hypothetical protein
MLKRNLLPLLGLCGLVVALGGRALDARAQEKVKDAVWKHGIDVYSRKAGEEDFKEKRTKKIAVECYQDENNNVGVYISETGSISIVPAKLFKGGDGMKSKAPLWQHGLELAARKFDEKDFSKTTTRFAFEVFKDENGGALLYVCGTGGIESVPAKYAKATPAAGKVKRPDHRYGMNLKVRKAGEENFTKDTRKVGIEVFKDENNGNLIYLSETGGFAVVPAELADSDEVVKKAKDPDWQHGLEVAVRKFGEEKFGKDTKRFGVEVYLDANNGNLIYACETGDISVVPAKAATKTPEGRPKAPTLTHALDLAARKIGEAKFSKETKRYGVEVYLDENNGTTLYVSETGDLSVASNKE